jgi:hypothetical protein
MNPLRNSSFHVNLNAMIPTKNRSSAKELIKDYSTFLKNAKLDTLSRYPDKGFYLEIYFEKELSSMKKSMKLIKKLNDLPFKDKCIHFNISFSYSDGVSL